ncbi:hypothetical protein LQE92_07560 [Lacrimispora sp. NSJ-141]|uniref:Uncharacterized protein n=1 Tax=Lientehia hominis TaxID=2897778 RepID=A0AAP2RI75_9FIRM|nr:hypothetical protein [Lientehia hominis]MCD2492487.1 hypothetical protein [Lientehia hominis]
MNVNFDKIMLKKNLTFSEIEMYARIVAQNAFVSISGDTPENHQQIYLPTQAERALVGLFYSKLTDGLILIPEDGEESPDYPDYIDNIELYGFFIKNRSLVSSIEMYAGEMIEYEKQTQIHSFPAVEACICEYLKREIKKLKAENKAVKEMERLAKAQAEKVENSNKVEAKFTLEEKADIIKKMSELNFDLEKLAEHMTKYGLKSNTDINTKKQVS